MIVQFPPKHKNPPIGQFKIVQHKDGTIMYETLNIDNDKLVVVLKNLVKMLEQPAI